MRNLRNFTVILTVYLIYKEQSSPQVENFVSYMRDTIVMQFREPAFDIGIYGSHGQGQGQG